jgi:D-arabinose 1-dehydrogenase-like Zn-dependent alcohol dehydrogenase
VGNIVPERVELNIGYIITSGIRIAGSSGATRADMAQVFALHETQPFQFVVHAELPLDRADAAQRMVRAGGLRGRVVLLPE